MDEWQLTTRSEGLGHFVPDHSRRSCAVHQQDALLPIGWSPGDHIGTCFSIASERNALLNRAPQARLHNSVYSGLPDILRRRFDGEISVSNEQKPGMCTLKPIVYAVGDTKVTW
jgi:hypothetical protein